MNEQLMIPVLPLRDAVLFPGIALPIGAGRPSTLRAIEAALRAPDPLVLAVAQRQNVDDVNPEGLYSVGTIARLGQVQRSLSGMQLVLHGERRGVALRYQERDGYYVATTITDATREVAWSCASAKPDPLSEVTLIGERFTAGIFVISSPSRLCEHIRIQRPCSGRLKKCSSAKVRECRKAPTTGCPAWIRRASAAPLSTSYFHERPSAL